MEQEPTPEQEISRGVVAIYKDHTGRGPDRARTTITDACATTILHDSLTKAEKTLVERGDADTVRQIRRRFQDVMREEITALVEAVTGRQTAVMLSDHHPDEDIAVEIVLFAPEAPAGG